MPIKQILESGTEMVRGSKKDNGNLLDGERHEADPFPKRLLTVEKRNTSALTSTERKQWHTALKVIEKGWKAFVEVGAALMEIRQSRLYRENYESWEAFCRDAVGISKTEANRQITDAEVVSELSAPNGATAGTGIQPPSKRSQVRALARLKKPEDRREAWRRVCETTELTGSPATAELVTEVVEAIRGDADLPPAGSTPRPPSGKPSTITISSATALDVLAILRAARRAHDWTIIDEMIELLQAGNL